MYVVRAKLLRRDWEDIKTSLYAGNALMIIVDLGIVLSWDLK
jgi:urea transporter